MGHGARAHVAADGSARITCDFNSDWRLFVGDAGGAQDPEFDDSGWKPVTLPRAWNEDDAFRVDIRELPTGIAWYRKRFTLPDSDLGKKVYLEFEGVRHVADVYLNGQHVGRHENGVMAFGMDLTGLIRTGQQANVVAVRVDNAWDVKESATGTPFQWSDRNFYANYGGINKRVWLHVADKLHQTLPLYSNLGTSGVYVYADDIDVPGKSATITAEAQVRNDHDSPRTFTFQVLLGDLNGHELARFAADAPLTLPPGQTTTVRASARVGGLEFWSWGYGRLYDVKTILIVDGKPIDAVLTRTGFRKTQFGQGVVTLNDRVIHLKGYAQRSTNEWPALGTNVPAWLSDFSNGLMVQGNANLVRWMHVTPGKQDVQSCDRVGLMQAMPAGDSERDPGPGRRWQMRLELMRDAIIYNRNHPSIIFYEAGNAGIADERMAEMISLRDQYDPHGGRAMGCRNMLGSSVAEYGGDMLYVNRSRSKPLWAMEYSRDEGLRKYWDEFSPPYHRDGDGPPHRGQPAHAYNRNQDSHALENVRRWFDYYQQRPGTGERVNAGGVNIIFSDTNTHHRGAENYRRSGEVDAVRLPKDGYFAHQVMWDGWVEPENPRIHIIGHWNYAPQTQKDVFVVSSAQRVQLLLNGRSLGFGQQSHRFLFTFKDVKWEPGVLQAVGFDAAGRQVCADQRRTAGEPVALRLTPHTSPTGMRADGADVALFDVEVVDDKGNRCPTALNPIHFELSGPGEWRGGIAQAPDNGILAKTLPVECGINRVIVRSTTTAGTIVLTAAADGLKPATASVQTRALAVEGGLGRELVGQELIPRFSRGPTPPGSSVTAVRQSLHPDRIVVGSNQPDAPKLTDDNEASAWTSDERLERAWVQFEFDQPRQVSQLVLRLGSWRTTSWPLRVFADGQEVFAAVAPATVGYTTLEIPPTCCRSVRLQLAGSPRAGGNAELVEVTGQADTHGGDNPRATGKLVIHEIELFSALPTATSQPSDPAGQ
ncbi:sugar-binding domain-containing protein [Fontivita pretiosa]|uniref:glycoside hydrolase family 2 protein n=1 Tax=Fontivita pretiosa TaxID=2989684 RepID=UPI003D16867F